jgi:bifunctional DNA-binding transcriptional regulator/antitoxin component of YhaV-PrlF toxin-antitoxin module
MLSSMQMDEIIRPYATVSDRIRALDAAGVARADIARFLDKRYQHVRNVLESDKQRGGYTVGRAELAGVHEQAATFEGPDDQRLVEARGNGAFRLIVRPDGSVVLPREVREAFNIERDGVVMAKLDGDTFSLISAETAMRRVREIVRQFVPPGVDLVAELIADRRAEAAAEMERD